MKSLHHFGGKLFLIYFDADVKVILFNFNHHFKAVGA